MEKVYVVYCGSMRTSHIGLTKETAIESLEISMDNTPFAEINEEGNFSIKEEILISDEEYKKLKFSIANAFAKIFIVGEYQVLIEKNYDYEYDDGVYCVTQTTEIDGGRLAASFHYDNSENMDTKFCTYSIADAEKFVKNMLSIMKDKLFG